jgi:aspartyl-tRNA(Asn)/glutamyl-tRNA(Gln) amidotransferase subunit A
VAYANSLDTVGILADGAAKIQTVFRTVSRFDELDPTSASSRTRALISKHPTTLAQLGRPLRIGIPIEYSIQNLHPAVHGAWTKLSEDVQKLGAVVVPVSLPSTRFSLSAYYVIAPAEASSNLARYDGVRFGNHAGFSDSESSGLYADRRGSYFGKEVKRRILLGTYTLSSEAMDNYFVKAQKVRRLVQRDFDSVFSLPNVLGPPPATKNEKHEETVDVILCPTAAHPPPRLLDLAAANPVQEYMTDVFTVPASLAGLPAISMPITDGKNPEKNIGMQLIGQYGTDELILSLSSVLEEHGLVRASGQGAGGAMRAGMNSPEQEKQESGKGMAGQQGPYEAFSPELVKTYVQMRSYYGDGMKAVQFRGNG